MLLEFVIEGVAALVELVLDAAFGDEDGGSGDTNDYGDSDDYGDQNAYESTDP